MPQPDPGRTGRTREPPVGEPRTRAFVYTAGFLRDRRVRRILTLAGFDLKLGRPAAEDCVLVWGHSRHAWRGERVAAATNADLVRVEDAFLRSLHPGRAGDPPLGLVIDRRGAHFDASRPSDLERLLARHPLDKPELLGRAEEAMARIAAARLTKYAATRTDLKPPDPGYVLVIDQTRDDASIRLGAADADAFQHMLRTAQQEHPDRRILIKTHPETAAGYRAGHFADRQLPPNAVLQDQPMAPGVLFEGAAAVYTVSSQLGFEAILAGHRPVTFGVPFYAGWGLSDDRGPVPDRRGRTLSVPQLAAGALLLYPTWYDPYSDRLCDIETVLGTLEAEARAWREDRTGYVAIGMRAWKRAPLKEIFQTQGGHLGFETQTARAARDGRPVLVWAGSEPVDLLDSCAAAGRPLIRVEDGFLRSRGLGARLIPPLSLAIDDRGIYYDPTRENRLEQLIAETAEKPVLELQRADRLIARLRKLDITKYNIGRSIDLPQAPNGRSVILVPGQVEDDASIRLGAGDVRTNAELLRTARRLYPDGWLVYKPHPDIEAGLRKGRIDAETLATLADHVAEDADPAALMRRADRVVTITSGLGFEALIRGVPVTTLGAPFYAGWGLTTDLGTVPKRRTARPSLAALVHAALIDYPRYHDPVTRRPCPVEVAIDRLASGAVGNRPIRLRVLARLQDRLADYSWIWRR